VCRKRAGSFATSSGRAPQPDRRSPHGVCTLCPAGDWRRLAALLVTGSQTCALWKPHDTRRSRGRAGIGASHQLPCVPAKIALPQRQRTLSLGGGNRSSCPQADLHDGTRIGRVGWKADSPSYLYLPKVTRRRHPLRLAIFWVREKSQGRSDPAVCKAPARRICLGQHGCAAGACGARRRRRSARCSRRCRCLCRWSPLNVRRGRSRRPVGRKHSRLGAPSL
jgi:hypothetical protein